MDQYPERPDGIVAKAHDPMHVMHKYWSRKPANVVRYLVEAHSTPGQVVLDPFCGSGTTISQASMTGRRSIGLDINPMALFITENTLNVVPIEKIVATYEQLKTRLERPINDLFKTRCHRCLNDDTTTTICFHWKVHHPIKVYFTCEHCESRMKGRSKKRSMKKFTKVPDAEDLALLDKIDATGIDAWYPRGEIPRGMVLDQARKAATTFAGLYTKRNLLALAMIFSEIGRLPSSSREDAIVKDLFTFAFTSMVHLCSKMAPVRPSRPHSSFWATNSYWVPRVFMESNAWLKFDSAINGPQGLVSSRRDARKKLGESPEIMPTIEALLSAPGSLEKPAPVYLAKASATSLENLLPECSVDLILTDPPYAGSIPYLELSMLWATWLCIDSEMSFDEEVLIHPAAGKDQAEYIGKLEQFFKGAMHVLKPGRFLVFTYHNLDTVIRHSILTAAVKAGFVLESIEYQAPPRPSAAHTMRPFNSAVGDYVVRFKKPLVASPDGGVLIPGAPEGSISYSKGAIEAQVADILESILLDLGKPATYTELLNHLDVSLSRQPWFLLVDVDPRTVLKKGTGRRFARVKEVINGKAGDKWWLHEKRVQALSCEEK